eukprot:CAMPEP_0119143646 /NCGR_PEP_ID=MMETSP1310-20130426/34650_1 /TAXON_ID=464262 /ORGANISM="Genus nov. species nov., Strain RCC2339" /LENGTH=104 /DNA_ID=CAMNT_0007135291 /DNA_START=98 /DNA_END=409 /DNA_ORIENTATION=+
MLNARPAAAGSEEGLARERLDENQREEAHHGDAPVGGLCGGREGPEGAAVGLLVGQEARVERGHSSEDDDGGEPDVGEPDGLLHQLLARIPPAHLAPHALARGE